MEAVFYFVHKLCTVFRLVYFAVFGIRTIISQKNAEKRAKNHEKEVSASGVMMLILLFVKTTHDVMIKLSREFELILRRYFRRAVNYEFISRR